jgi:hypothetical protein
MREFQRQFATEEACQDYLAACRWPDTCPRCGHRRAYRMKELQRWQYAACRYQVSLTAGTILHNTKTPLTVWFWASYLTVTDKRGMSALHAPRFRKISIRIGIAPYVNSRRTLANAGWWKSTNRWNNSGKSSPATATNDHRALSTRFNGTGR